MYICIFIMWLSFDMVLQLIIVSIYLVSGLWNCQVRVADECCTLCLILISPTCKILENGLSFERLSITANRYNSKEVCLVQY